MQNLTTEEKELWKMPWVGSSEWIWEAQIVNAFQYSLFYFCVSKLPGISLTISPNLSKVAAHISLSFAENFV